MWQRLRRAKSKAKIHNASSPKFACSSFKDVHSLLYDLDIGAGAPSSSSSASSYAIDSPRKPSIFHRVRSVNSLLLSDHGPDSQIRIPGTEQTVVIFFTSIGVVRRTFEDCKTVRTILRSLNVSIDERDLSMDSRFMDEIQRIMNQSEKSKLTLPIVFIGGRYIGGVEEVRRLAENGELKKYIEGIPCAEPGTCEACGGYRFILCEKCNGSHKCYNDKVGFRSCTSCNENGLVRCPSCSSAPL